MRANAEDDLLATRDADYGTERAQVEFAWQCRRVYELDHYGKVLMVRDGESFKLDREGRRWNSEIKQAQVTEGVELPWDMGCVCDRAGSPQEPEPGDIIPESDDAATRLAAHASGTRASAGSTGISTVGPSDAAARARAAAVATAHTAVSAVAIEAAASADAEAPAASTPIDVTEDARPLSAMHIPRTMPPPLPFLEHSTDAAAPAGAIQPPPEIMPPIHILDGRVEARPELDRDLICSPEGGADEQRLRGVQSTLPTPQPMAGRRVRGPAPTWISWLTSGCGMYIFETDSTRTV